MVTTLHELGAFGALALLASCGKASKDTEMVVSPAPDSSNTSTGGSSTGPGGTAGETGTTGEPIGSGGGTGTTGELMGSGGEAGEDSSGGSSGGSTCDDQLTNGDETDADCGGACGPCPPGAACLESTDCASENCTDMVCTEQRPELGACGASPEALVTWESEEELYDLIVGAWLICPDYAEDLDSAEPGGVMGIEFNSDDTYSFLFADEAGELVRGTGIDASGDWYPGTDGMTSDIVVVVPSGGGFSLYRPSFTVNPTQLRMDEYFGKIFHSARYVPIEL